MTATLTPDTNHPTPPAPSPGAPPRAGWEKGALTVLLVGTAGLYLWNLSAGGWGNDFYSGAVQAMTRSWEAFFFGSSDAGNTVTVDKPPGSLWVMAASARIFGLSSWSILVPQALMGVGTVALLHAAVRRVSGPGAALIAGAAMALTPVAVLMFRFNNPDALLVLLMVAAAYAVVRAVENAGTRWLVLAGILIGLGFLTKTAQVLLVLPALALAYLWAAPTGLGRRIRQLLGAGVAMVVAGGWWFVAVELWPAASRPYIGGSTTNSALELAFDYNGLGRIFGENRLGGRAGGGGPGGGFPGGGSPFGSAGVGRLFASDVGGQVAWLLPAALALLLTGLLLTRRAPRTDQVRASQLLWGGWTLVTVLVFSFMSGTFHQYYTVALAPGIAGMVGVGGAELWRRRASWPWRATLAVIVAGTVGWAVVLLARTPDFAPWARWVVGGLGVVAVVGLLLGARGRLIATGALAATVLATSVGPVAYAADTISASTTSPIPLAGPATAGGFGGMPGGPGGMPGPGRTGPGGLGAGGGRGGGRGGGFGGAATDPALTAMLESAGTKWSAATLTASSASRLALDSRTDVMGIGGFMGSDPAPTLAHFQASVAAGEVRYFIEGGGPGGMNLAQLPQSVRENPQFAQFMEQAERDGGPGTLARGTGSEITTWVQQHYPSSTVGGRTVYDLAKPK